MKHFVALFLFCPFAIFGQKLTISGYITDTNTGERLIGASVTNKKTNTGVVSNAFGFYSLEITGNEPIMLVANYLGYSEAVYTLVIKTDTTLHLSLTAKKIDLETVTVSSNKYELRAGTEALPLDKIQQIPMLLGEADILRLVLLLPGVQAGSEGSTGFHVRGGSPDQNLILLDGVPVYNASHFFGFFSVFNTDAIKKADLIKGGFPARYGGRLSSVLDITMNDGNTQVWKGNASIGLLSSKVMLEGSLVKDKVSLLATARGTFYNQTYRPLIYELTGANAPLISFGDLTAKISYAISEKDKLLFSVYAGNDELNTLEKRSVLLDNGISTNEDKAIISWGNVTGALRWNRVLSNKLFSNVSLIYSQYRFEMGAENKSTLKIINMPETTTLTAITYSSAIKDIGLKWDLDYFLSAKHQIKAGLSATNHQFTPKALQLDRPLETVKDTAIGNTPLLAYSFTTFIEDEFSITENLKANAGVHFSNFYVRGVLYPSLQPRLSLSYDTEKLWRYSLSYASMQQPIHLLSNTGAGLPTDMWVSSTDVVQPQKAWQVAAGVAKKLQYGISVSIEGYYKDMQHVIEYSEGINFLDEGPETNLLEAGTQTWEDKIEVGRGWAYGIEFSIKKEVGKTTGWIAYTYAHSNRIFENLNNGDPFPYRYDRRHDANFVLTHRLSSKIDFGLSWVFNTGFALTLPLEGYQGHPDVLGFSGGTNNTIEHFTQRNNYRMPNYHRLDLSCNWHKVKKKGVRTWSFSVYNAYNRFNPYYVKWEGNNKTVLQQTALFPILPAFSYKFDFDFNKK